MTKYGILEGLIPQEKPFKNIDNKYYFVVGHSYKKNVGRIIKFINNADIIKIDDSDGRQLEKIDLGVSMGKSLYITNKSGFIKYVTHGKKNNDKYFRLVYRGNNDGKIKQFRLFYI